MTVNIKTCLYISLSVLTLGLGCQSGPKVISAPEASAGSSEIFSGEPTTQTFSETKGASFSDELHTVVVKEVLPTERYVYLQVEEGNETFWIATRKQDIVKGATYFYRNGLLKTDFESKEYKRTFDKIYLVSSLVAQEHGGNSLTGTPGTQASSGSWSTGNAAANPAPSADALSIASLVKNPQKYAGKTVRIEGTCVKVNPNIMGRNWVHIQDGSQNDFDLVITTSALIQEGQAVKLMAVVGLDRDFGAGYKYDLILENGTLVP